MADLQTCWCCGLPIRPHHSDEPRTPASGWVAPGQEDPTACDPSAPGHAPAPGLSMHLWLVHDDTARGESCIDTVSGYAVDGVRRQLDEWSAASRRHAALGWGEAPGRYELRPIPPGEGPQHA